MTKYEWLQDRVARSPVLFVPVQSERIPAQSMRMDGECAIFFDESAFETDAERAVALSHEKGHCDAGAFYTLLAPFETRGRCEQRAWRRSVFELTPFDELMKAFGACATADGVTAHDLAEYLDTTADFVLRAIEIYVRLGEMAG